MHEIQKPPEHPLLLLQIQTGVLGNLSTPNMVTTAMTTTVKPMITNPSLNSITTKTTVSRLATEANARTSTKAPVNTTTKANKLKKSGAPPLSHVGGGNFLFFLINTLIYLYLS